MSLLTQKSEQFKEVSDAGLMSCLQDANKYNPLYLDGMLIKLSLTFCLKSGNPSMRSIARSILFQFVDYRRFRHKLGEKVNEMDATEVLDKIENNLDTFSERHFLVKGLLQLFKVSVLVRKDFLMLNISIIWLVL